MKKHLILAITVAFLLSCSDNDSDKYIGIWDSKNKDAFIVIKKAGDIRYAIKLQYNAPRTRICKFEDGCFITDDKDKIVLLCTNNRNLILSNGDVFHRKAKINE